MQQVCKCCGRTMEVSETAYTTTCHFCGKQQTLPPCHTPKLRKQYAQIYALRQSGAFSAAIEQIEHLLHLYPEESEWYWQRLLCRYGMVYLPDIGKKTYSLQCTQPLDCPISEDADYLAALQFAKPETEHYYEADATLLEQERLEECHPSDPEKNAEWLLESGFQSLEAEHWQLATAQFDLLLQRQPENANAHLGKMMAQLQVRREEELLKTGNAMEQTEQYAELMQHADPAFREKILQYEKKAKYQQAVLMKEKANSVEALQAAIDLLETIPNDPDAERLIVVCKRQMRERMLAYSEVLIGCHAAEHLILSGESEEKRIIVAKYYYDSDTEEEEQAAAAAERHAAPLKIIDLRTILLLIAVVGLAAALVIVLFFQKEAPQVQPERHTYPAIPSISTLLETDSSHSATTETKQSVKADAKIESNPIVSQIEPTQALFTADADAIACGEYRYVLSEGNLYRIEAVGSNSGQEKILEQIQEILPDQDERLLYLQAGTVGFLQANGDFGDAISNNNIKKLFLLPTNDQQNSVFLLSEDGMLSAFQYIAETNRYEPQAIFMDADAVTAQVSGWETVANLEIIDHILIGTDEKGAPVHAISLQF